MRNQKEQQAKKSKAEPAQPAWKALERLAPALRRVLSPERGNIWFDKTKAFAAGSYMGIEVPYSSGLRCGVSGETLLRLLAGADTINMRPSDDAVKISFGGQGHVTLPAVALDRNRTWHFPAAPPKGALGWVLTKELLAAFGRVSGVRAAEPTSVLHQGIVMLPTKQGWDLYATDSTAFARTQVAMEMPKTTVPPRIFPHELVEVMGRYCHAGDKLFFLQDCLAIYGTQLSVFIGYLDVAATELEAIALPLKEINGVKAKAPIPPQLGPMLRRARLLANTAKDAADMIKLEAEGSEIHASGKFALGALEEILPCALPRARLQVSAGKLASLISGAVKDIALAEREQRVVLTGADTTYILAAVEET